MGLNLSQILTCMKFKFKWICSFVCLFAKSGNLILTASLGCPLVIPFAEDLTVPRSPIIQFTGVEEGVLSSNFPLALLPIREVDLLTTPRSFVTPGDVHCSLFICYPY